MVVHRRGCRLDDEDVGAAHVLIDLNVRLTIREAVEGDVARCFAEALADLVSKRGVGATREKLQRTRQAAVIIQIGESTWLLLCGDGPSARRASRAEGPR